MKTLKMITLSLLFIFSPIVLGISYSEYGDTSNGSDESSKPPSGNTTYNETYYNQYGNTAYGSDTTFEIGPEFVLGILVLVTAIIVGITRKPKKKAEEVVLPKEVIPPPKKVAPRRYVGIPIRGLRYKNTDGTSRKEFLKSCNKFQRLLLIPEPSNPFDPNAITVCTESNNQLGYVPRELAKIIAPLIVSGKRFACTISDIEYRGGESHCYILISDLGI